jgi:hypothetical protein
MWGSSPTNRGPQTGSPPGVVDWEGSSELFEKEILP